MTNHRHCEGLQVARFFMVLSSFSPLFVIWAIRGSDLIADMWFISACAVLVGIPNGFLAWRIITARKLREKRELTVGAAEDHRLHFLGYLAGILLSFFAADFSSWRETGAVIVALTVIIFLFSYLNLHYLNLVFAVFGYRIFTVQSPSDNNPVSGKSSCVLITQQRFLSAGNKLVAYRLSNTVYLELRD